MFNRTFVASCLKKKSVLYNHFYVIISLWGDTGSNTLRLYSLCSTVLLDVVSETLYHLSTTHLTVFQMLTFRKKKQDELSVIKNVKFKS